MIISLTRLTALALSPVLLATALHTAAYPLDGYEETGIRRVEGARLAHEGLATGGKQPQGALLPTPAVDLRLQGLDVELPPAEPALTGKIEALLGENLQHYGVAVLDFTDRENPVYAQYRDDLKQNVGSVGKLLAALGLFQALADAWPDDLERRAAVLRDTVMTADDFSVSDHHTIRLFDVESRDLTRRPMAIGDQGSLWEYLDWMLSVSSNSAAAMVMRDAMLLRHFGKDYPVTEQQIDSFFDTATSAELTALFQRTFWEPVTRNGLPLDQIRQGSFFTRQGKANVNGGGISYATPRTLIEFLLKMEEGQLVDEWSSRQLKRLLYMTERRIRYASSPALRNAAVYFKSGSLYSCGPEEGFTCKPYHGNIRNYMNSVAIVEEEVEGVQLQYMVVVISNILRQNSAVDHQTLGTRIHQLMKERHKPAPAPPTALQAAPAAGATSAD